ncbi:hypothetical protein FRX31_028589 [Thalictrum thalictroides]|uniref:Uncharacterized protein n=1 Tax=Thalictrum thalictroides TaxID=46969 RepID=A0A7J6VA29_THATH|nr:hypothetical protein FRX31_028589 [Thalictrum thalictroides]
MQIFFLIKKLVHWPSFIAQDLLLVNNIYSIVMRVKGKKRWEVPVVVSMHNVATIRLSSHPYVEALNKAQSIEAKLGNRQRWPRPQRAA